MPYVPKVQIVRLSPKKLHRLPKAAEGRWVVLLPDSEEEAPRLMYVHRTQGGTCAHGTTFAALLPCWSEPHTPPVETALEHELRMSKQNEEMGQACLSEWIARADNLAHENQRLGQLVAVLRRSLMGTSEGAVLLSDTTEAAHKFKAIAELLVNALLALDLRNMSENQAIRWQAVKMYKELLEETGQKKPQQANAAVPDTVAPDYTQPLPDPTQEARAQFMMRENRNKVSIEECRKQVVSLQAHPAFNPDFHVGTHKPFRL